jgi:hypothetical protein
MMEGVNSTMVDYKNFCKCHNVPPVQNNMVIRKWKKSFAFKYTSSEPLKIKLSMSFIITSIIT